MKWWRHTREQACTIATYKRTRASTHSLFLSHVREFLTISWIFLTTPGPFVSRSVADSSESQFGMSLWSCLASRDQSSNLSLYCCRIASETNVFSYIVCIYFRQGDMSLSKPLAYFFDWLHGRLLAISAASFLRCLSRRDASCLAFGSAFRAAAFCAFSSFFFRDIVAKQMQLQLAPDQKGRTADYS